MTKKPYPWEIQRFIRSWDDERLRRVAEGREIRGYQPAYEVAIREEYNRRFGEPAAKPTLPAAPPIHRPEAEQKRSEKILSNMKAKAHPIEIKEYNIFTTTIQWGINGKTQQATFEVPEGENIENTVLSAMSTTTGIPILRLKRDPTVKRFIVKVEEEYREWEKGARGREIYLSKNIQSALNMLQTAEVEFGGYILADEKQELHLIEGREESVCPLRTSIPTIAVHTHPKAKSTPSAADIDTFLRCPTTPAEMIFGDDGTYIMTKPNAYDGLAPQDFVDLFNAIAKDTGKSVTLHKGTLSCHFIEEAECDGEISYVYNKMFDLLHDAFDINKYKQDKNAPIRVKI